MNDSRRNFLKKAALLSAGFSGLLPPSVQRAFAINPQEGSTYLDAEHVVILMQENRSFDHAFGSLQGVRGFNDPRAISLSNKNKVWLQTDEEGRTFAPFRLDIKGTKSTWMGALPHGWTDQVDARNDGKFDKWLQVKKSGHKEFRDMPLTLGYYNREDIPFYYSLADAFTICDQNFSSSLTGTTPNRLFLWTGAIKDPWDQGSLPRVRNEELDYHVPASWKTFPETLEDNSVPWKIYQNEISVGVGFDGEEDAWLGNFTDNPMEWFTQFNVKFHPAFIQDLPRRIARLEKEIAELRKQARSMTDPTEQAKINVRLNDRERLILIARDDAARYTIENFEKLSSREKELHRKAFATNTQDKDYHALTLLKYKDNGQSRSMHVPKGDVLHRFRTDVKTGKLPAVSWLVAPENFSDHPGAPWYGAWYISEVLDILTRQPEVWKKTIFILAYDENDGYFDHIPPFVPPDPNRPGSGSTSSGIDLRDEFVTLAQDMQRRPAATARGHAVGLGYRVPLLIASPWSRGGMVNSQVFDHTSVIQFLEKFLSHKTGRKIREENISSWRRMVCGDLTSAFRPYQGEQVSIPEHLQKNSVLKSIHQSQFKQLPKGFKALTQEEIEAFNRGSSSLQPKQEPGSRASCALPYELYVDGGLAVDKKTFEITFKAGTEMFGEKSAGSPFQVYAPGQNNRTWYYAVNAGDAIKDVFALNEFERNYYRLAVYGPNGFFREFLGSEADPLLTVACAYGRDSADKPTGHVGLNVQNRSTAAYTLMLHDYAYKKPNQRIEIPAGSSMVIPLDLSGSNGWYDFGIKVGGFDLFQLRYAGRVESGRTGTTDPAMA